MVSEHAPETSTDCARATVEGAAAALAAFGLLPWDDVTAFGEKTDAALERAGLIKRISVESSESAVVRMSGAGAQDRGATHPRRELEQVVPVGVETDLPDGGRLVLLSVNRWSVGFDLLLALLDNPAAHRDVLKADWQWTIVDDAGLRYDCHTSGASGGRDALWLRAHGRPPIRPTAKRLEIQLDRDGVRLLSTSLNL